MGPTGPSAGLNPGPWMGFKSYSGRGGPVGGIIFFPCFLFSLLLYLFCFVSTYNKKLFILFLITYVFYFNYFIFIYFTAAIFIYFTAAIFT